MPTSNRGLPYNYDERERLTISAELYTALKKRCIDLEQGWSPAKLSASVRKFVRTKLKCLDDLVYRQYSKADNLPSNDNYARAFGEKDPGYVSMNNNYYLQDLLSYYAEGVNYEDFQDKVLREAGLNTGVNAIFKSNKILHITESFWDKHKIYNTDKQNDLSRFYTHIDSRLITTAVATDDFVVTPTEVFQVMDSDENMEERTLAEIFDTAESQSFSLIKVLSEGGTGKSTFLYWVAKKYYKKYCILFIKTFSSESLNIIKNILSIRSQQFGPSFLLIIDNISELTVEDSVSTFVEEIKNICTPNQQVIFLVAERENRYNSQFDSYKFELPFIGNIQVINYKPADKELIFDKVYSLLSIDNKKLHDEELKLFSKDIFINNSISSISESVIQLLDFLKLKRKIQYDFDWDDWNLFIENSKKRGLEYSELENLFVAVACFYQFGIKVSIEFYSSIFPKANKYLILRALSTFNSDKSPILLDDTANFLYLKHELIASWFLRNNKHQGLTKNFFRDFLKNINTAVSAKLLRKIRKILLSNEFKKSCLAKEISFKECLNIINTYLQLPIDVDEKRNMLQEKGICLLRMGMKEEAIKAFEFVIQKFPENNHARDQLAKIYLKDHLFQQTLDYYSQILKNKGEYVLALIYKHLKKCRSENIELEYENMEINIESLHRLIVDLISNKELDLAEELLENIKEPIKYTPSCYFDLARSLLFSEENIEKKKKFFKKAIALDKYLNPESRNLNFGIEYAVFLFRIGQDNSLVILKEFNEPLISKDKIITIDIYFRKVKSTIRLFFQHLPDRTEVDKVEKFLRRQIIDAAHLIKQTVTAEHRILRGFLLLKSVKHHSEYNFPNVYNDTIVRLAYCYSKHAEKNWNNLSPYENRLIADKYFDELKRLKIEFTLQMQVDMLGNLTKMPSKAKNMKAINLINDLFVDDSNKIIAQYYRIRGTAKKNLGKYSEALKDYKDGLSQCVDDRFENKEYLKTEKSLALNNIALWIYDAFAMGYPKEGYSLKHALLYCDQIEKINPKFIFLDQIRQKIISFRNKR